MKNKENNIKLFVADYDGTIYTDDINLSINRKRLLMLHKLGFIINISTGRSFESIKEQVDKHKLYYDYLTCADGSVIIDKDDNIVLFNEIDSNAINEFIEFTSTVNYEEIQFVYPKYYGESPDLDKIAGINIAVSTELLREDKSIFERFNKLKNKLTDYNFLNYCHYPINYLCFKKKGVTKASSIDYLRKYYNLEKDSIYVIGDSYNDIEMITEFNGVRINNNNPDMENIGKKMYYQVYEYIDEIINNKI